MARIGLAGLLLMVFAREARAQALEPFVVSDNGDAALAVGMSLRNGDWLAVDALGVGLQRSRKPPGYAAPYSQLAIVARGEFGLGGISAGLGVATNTLGGECPPPKGCDANDFLGSGMLSLEGRVTRMYGPTSWHDATYVGGQVSLAFIFIKPSVGWMVNSAIHATATSRSPPGWGGSQPTVIPSRPCPTRPSSVA